MGNKMDKCYFINERNEVLFITPRSCNCAENYLQGSKCDHSDVVKNYGVDENMARHLKLVDFHPMDYEYGYHAPDQRKILQWEENKRVLDKRIKLYPKLIAIGLFIAAIGCLMHIFF